MEQWQGQAAIAAALGYFGQWVKSFKQVPTWLAQAILVLSAVAAYALVAIPKAGHVQEWIVGAITFALTTLGVASLAAGTGLAPKTDSK